MYFIGKRLWPEPCYWACGKCDAINPWEMRECEAEECTAFRRGKKLTEAEANALYESRQQDESTLSEGAAEA